jgi:polyhydroxybutyrate depolymerase
MTIFFSFLLLLACASSSDSVLEEEVSEEEVIDEEQLLELKDKSFTIDQEIAGVVVSREVIMEVPTNIDLSKDYPIVFAFHGRGSLNDSWVNKLNPLTSTGSFVGIYPQGHDKMWNSGGNESSKANDVAFVGAIIEALKQYKNLDFERIYAIGTSNGSSMTNKLALETDYFNAVASIVSQLSEANLPDGNTHPTAIFQINGGADEIIPIDGGSKLGYVFLEALDSAQRWATAFSCDSYQMQTIDQDKLYVFPNCKEGKEVRYLRIENGLHNLHWTNPLLMNDVWDFLKRF